MFITSCSACFLPFLLLFFCACHFVKLPLNLTVHVAALSAAISI